MARAHIYYLKEDQVAYLLNLTASSSAGIKGGGKDATSTSRGSTWRHGQQQAREGQESPQSCPLTPLSHQVSFCKRFRLKIHPELRFFKGFNKIHTTPYSLLGLTILLSNLQLKGTQGRSSGIPHFVQPLYKHLESHFRPSELFSAFWAAAVDYAGAFGYFELELIGNFEEGAANCSANHSNSSHATILK